MFRPLVFNMFVSTLLIQIQSRDFRTFETRAYPVAFKPDFTETNLGMEHLSEDRYDTNGDVVNLRLKRGNIFAIKGLAALNRLLEGTQPIGLHSPYRQWFEKLGDFTTAQEDFYAVRPKNVKIYSGRVNPAKDKPVNKVLQGVVGDRKIILQSHGEGGKPVMEIIDSNVPSGPYINKIIYRKDGE